MNDEQDTAEEPAADTGSGGSTADAGGGNRWVLWLLVVIAVFVGGGAFYHLSSENASKWFLEVRNGDVVVRKGIWFPTGAADYDEGGPAYDPVPLPEGMDPPARVHDSSQSVDNAIYRLLVALASSAIESGDANRIETAKGLLGRARLLAGISQDQADEVLRYRGDIAMAEGHLAIKQVQTLLVRAKQRVEAGAAKGTRLYKDPAGWVRWIDAKLAEFSSLDDAREPPASLCAPGLPAPSPPPSAAEPPAAAPVLDPLAELTSPLPPPTPAGADTAGADTPATPEVPAPSPAPVPEIPAPAPAAPTEADAAPATTPAPAAPTTPANDSGLSFPLFPEAPAPAPGEVPDKKDGEVSP